MRPENLKTKIFLDSGDPKETKKALDLLGFLDGQTTNPSLIVKSSEVMNLDKKFTPEELLEKYKVIIQKISSIIPEGDISIEVYADENTKAEQMIESALQMNQWINNGKIKFPTTTEGINAAIEVAKENIKVNMTLCFSQEQAAAIHSALNFADVFISPFVGRLNDIRINGLDLIKNIVRSYKNINSNVKILSASIRDVSGLIASINEGADIVTVPLKVIEDWVSLGMPLNLETENDLTSLKSIDYLNLDFKREWTDFNISHDLTTKGIQKFAEDWNKLISN